MAQPRCKAHSKQTGQQCGLTAAPGSTVCRFHGAGAPAVKAKAQQRLDQAEAAEMARSFGLPQDIDPQTAILDELHRTAGSVAWLTEIVSGFDRERVVNGVTKIETRTGFQAGRVVTVEGKPSAWIELWQSERRHLVQVSTAAHRMGIDVAQTKAIETAGQVLAAAITRILDRLSLSGRQQMVAGQVVPDVLRSLGRSGGPEQIEGEIVDDGSVNR